MIGWLKGHIIDKQQPGKLLIDVNGVGYEVETSLNTFFAIETKANPLGLYIHTVVREDAFLLFGFEDKLEQALFRALIKINGIGPKVALAILSSITAEELIQSIRDENAQRLTKLPGIGKKTAERLIIEMKDSINTLSDLPHGSISKIGQQAVTIVEEATSALEALGYKYQDARKIVKQLDDGQKNCEEIIRQSLKLLSNCKV